mmetsp:Transcript_9008/g.13898  ORF Transcript_9008/g.13898 Transcript_9008/m.13898 type:complete len:198 (+) Transcript_9008:26-619(+)|eukprot:CAMPEP_0202697268 /NCGR_PEP_ID=MMETSP1385-20130828/10599_1 /ASSEMBLY_ACC=CAM_ASM_000861 /TAXON_ID=933848 /ORGANISM="Elphidium margaritaceum" /LENGTH=197 /DNA_ID=CAMNT_0049353685 /DNA_START=16 /DNA_END=609 /DNA_ORIENTATION=-
MVTFTCEKCQWSGKKKQVEKHYNKCRGEWFSCVDCGKSFGEDYTKHIACVDEQDKYHGKWAKSQIKQKNRQNHEQLSKRKENGAEKSQSSNGAKSEPTPKRKREQEADTKDVAEPATKKQKTETTATVTTTANGSAKKSNHKKQLKQILKTETKESPISLKSVYDKFVEQSDADKDEANNIFLQTLWKLNDKVMIKL